MAVNRKEEVGVDLVEIVAGGREVAVALNIGDAALIEEVVALIGDEVEGNERRSKMQVQD